MAQVNRKVQSGNRLVVMFDGKEIGLLKSVRCSDSYGLEPASGIGDIHVQEHVPTVARHTLSVTGLLLKNDQMRAAGLFPENGDTTLEGLVFDIVSMDKDTGAVLRKYVGCSYDSGDVDISAHAIVSRSAQFMALDVQGTGA